MAYPVSASRKILLERALQLDGGIFVEGDESSHWWQMLAAVHGVKPECVQQMLDHAVKEVFNRWENSTTEELVTKSVRALDAYSTQIPALQNLFETVQKESRRG